MVAPLTTALMASVPVRNAGVGSAINNAISRVGQPLILALLFIPITAVFYGVAGDQRIRTSTSADPAIRAAVQPLNPPNATINLIDRVRHQPGVHRRLPPRDARRRRAAVRRGGRERRRACKGGKVERDR